MTVLDYIDNRMPLDESHLDSHIEEYIGGWVERKVFEKKLFIYLCTVPLFSATIPLATSSLQKVVLFTVQ